MLRRGERVFQRNCAHCHAADGTGRNWIGSFLDPHPPDFTRQDMAPRLIAARVADVTRDGLPGSSMPAWRSVLSARDIAAVSAYVERAFGAPGSATTDPRSTRPQSAAAAPAPPSRRTTDGS
ncbi:MAG: cytochrome c [Burkholderiaceae bacterium]|nr:cytochrome c [Burkholderiaceae bacterium]